MAYDLVDIKRRLDALRNKEHIIKKRIIKKIENCYFAVFHHVPEDKRTTEVQSDLTYIGGLLEKYSENSEYLTQEHLIILNEIYRKYR